MIIIINCHHETTQIMVRTVQKVGGTGWLAAWAMHCMLPPDKTRNIVMQCHTMQLHVIVRQYCNACHIMWLHGITMSPPDKTPNWHHWDQNRKYSSLVMHIIQSGNNPSWHIYHSFPILAFCANLVKPLALCQTEYQMQNIQHQITTRLALVCLWCLGTQGMTYRRPSCPRSSPYIYPL